MIIVVSRTIDRQVVVAGIELEMLVVVVGEVHGIATAIAHDEELHEAHEGIGVTITSFLLIAHNLLHGFEGRYAVTLELDLHQWETVDENDYIVALVAIGCVDRELVDYLKIVFAPVTKVNQTIVEGRTVAACEGLFLAQAFSCGEDIGGDVLVE